LIFGNLVHQNTAERDINPRPLVSSLRERIIGQQRVFPNQTLFSLCLSPHLWNSGFTARFSCHPSRKIILDASVFSSSRPRLINIFDLRVGRASSPRRGTIQQSERRSSPLSAPARRSCVCIHHDTHSWAIAPKDSVSTHHRVLSLAQGQITSHAALTPFHDL
jgi:hypothetical protein